MISKVIFSLKVGVYYFFAQAPTGHLHALPQVAPHPLVNSGRRAPLPGPGGGGGGTRLLNWIGGAAVGGGVKTWPCHNALGARKIHPVTIYLTKNIQMHIPCCNIAHLGYTLSDWGCWADKQKKKKSPRLRLERGPVIKHYGHVTLW